MTMTTMSTLGIGAGVTALVAGWGQVKAIAERIVGLLIVTVEIQDRCHDAMTTYCWQKLKRSPSPFRYYKGRIKFIKPLGRYGSVAYETFGDKGQMFWQGRKPLWVKTSGEYADKVAIRFIRWTFNADDLLREIMHNHTVNHEDSLYSNSGVGRFRINRMSGRSGKDILGMSKFGNDKDGEDRAPENTPVCGVTTSEATEGRLIGWSLDEIGEGSLITNPIERLALSEEVENVISEIRRWYKSHSWYTERQIPWRRGYLLYGPPGTGKSSLTKALAQDLKIPIFLFDISTMDNQEFHKAWQTALANTPAIALIEDIDAVFHGRDNVVAEKGQGLTYDCLLNVISGVESADGLLLIVTTNCLEHVDPALGLPQEGMGSTRPGRVDRAVEMPVLTNQGRIKLATRILNGCHPSWIDYLTRIGENDTGAQFEDRCTTTALDLFWGGDSQRPAPDTHPINTRNVFVVDPCDVDHCMAVSID